MARKRLGELLIEAGAITPEQLERALNEQKEWGGPLGQVLLNLNYIDEDGLVKALSNQLGIPMADLDRTRVAPTVLEMVPPEFCRDNRLLPFNYEKVGAFLDVAMVEPVDLDTLDRIRVMTQCNVRPHFATYGSLARSLYRYHGFQLKEWRVPKGQLRPSRRIDSSLLDAREKNLEPAEPLPKTITMRSVSKEKLEAEKALNAARPAAGSAEPAAGSLEAQPDMEPDRVWEKHLAKLEALLQANYQRVIESEQRISDLESLLQRDERVLRRILGLMVDKGLISKEELQRILKL